MAVLTDSPPISLYQIRLEVISDFRAAVAELREANDRFRKQEEKGDTLGEESLDARYERNFGNWLGKPGIDPNELVGVVRESRWQNDLNPSPGLRRENRLDTAAPGPSRTVFAYLNGNRRQFRVPSQDEKGQGSRYRRRQRDHDDQSPPPKRPPEE
jgi:hypothetical protein